MIITSDKNLTKFLNSVGTSHGVLPPPSRMNDLNFYSSENHRIFGVGGDPVGSLSPTLEWVTHPRAKSTSLVVFSYLVPCSEQLRQSQKSPQTLHHLQNPTVLPSHAHPKRHLYTLCTLCPSTERVTPVTFSSSLGQQGGGFNLQKVAEKSLRQHKTVLMMP